MKYKIITFGCAMNHSDAERVASVLENMGYIETDDLNQADLAIIMACSVRQTAIDRIYGYKRKFQKIRNKRPLITILSGCVIESEKKKMLEFFDEIINIKDINKLSKILKNESILSCKDYLKINPIINLERDGIIILKSCINNQDIKIVKLIFKKNYDYTFLPIKNIIEEMKPSHIIQDYLLSLNF